MAEAIVCVHYFYLRQIVVAIQGEGVEDNVCVDAGGLVGACEGRSVLVGFDKVLGLDLWDRHLEEGQGLIFPDLGKVVSLLSPVLLLR